MDLRQSYLRTIAATPEYVLAVIRNEYLQQLEHDPEAEPDMDLCFESTIADWRTACDLVPWRQLGQALGEIWHIHASNHEWQKLLEPAKTRTLGELCVFIAAHTTQPTIQPSRILGASCMSGGAFLAIRKMLAEAGVDVRKLKPSSELQPYLATHFQILTGNLIRIAPGQVPLVKCRSSLTINRRNKGLLCAGLLLGGLLAWLTWSSLGPLFPALLAMLMAGICIEDMYELSIPGCTTFRDLIDYIYPRPQPGLNTKLQAG